VKLDKTTATLSFNTDYTKLKKLLTALKESRLNNRILSLTVSTIQEKPEGTSAEAAEESAPPASTETPGESAAPLTSDTADTTDVTLDTEQDITNLVAADISSSSASAPAIDKNYGLQVIMVLEFFNLKGETDKLRPTWNTFKQGKTDLFQ